VASDNSGQGSGTFTVSKKKQRTDALRQPRAKRPTPPRGKRANGQKDGAGIKSNFVGREPSTRGGATFHSDRPPIAGQAVRTGRCACVARLPTANRSSIVPTYRLSAALRLASIPVVAAALVGTFLGILLSYGLVQPLATNAELQEVIGGWCSRRSTTRSPRPNPKVVVA
jgi:hypothetical protein